MNNLLKLIKKELFESIRTKKAFTLSVVLLFIAVSSPITAKLLPMILKSIDLQGIQITIPEPTFHDAIDQFIKNISQIGIFIIIFLVSGLLADEKTNKTLEILLTKPVSRMQVILSKFASAYSLLTISFIITATIFYTYTLSLFGNFSLGNFAMISGFILLYILTVASVTIYASTIAKNNLAAAGIGIVFMLLVPSLFGLIKELAPYSPAFILGSYKNIMANGFMQEMIKPTIASLLFIGSSIYLSVQSFQKMEIER